MRFFLRCSFVTIFFLTFSLTGFTLNVTDDCTGNSSLQPQLKNLQANKDIKNITQENIGATGYYTLKNRQERHGEVIYQIENVESLTVKTYSPLASFFTVNDSGEPVRGFSGPLKKKILGRLFTNPSINVILAPVNPLTPQDGEVYYCTAGEFLYEFSRGKYANPSHLRPYGLSIETSVDGNQYHTVPDSFTVTQINGQGYLENHQVTLAGKGPYIRLNLSCASTLMDASGTFKDNSIERPINIISVQFDIRETMPPEELPSSSSSEPEPSPPSTSDPPSSFDSDFKDDPAPVVVHRKSSSSKRKNISDDADDSDDDPDIYEPNEVIHEPSSFTITNPQPPKEAADHGEDESSDRDDISIRETDSLADSDEIEMSETTQETSSETEETVPTENLETSQISPTSEQDVFFSSDTLEDDIPENDDDIDRFDKLFLGAYSIIILFIIGRFGMRAIKIYCQTKYQNSPGPKEK